ncbi:17020_t:CDS:2, partial [Racocetra fulgida]
MVAEIDMSNKRLVDDEKKFEEEIEHKFAKNPALKVEATIPLPWAFTSLNFGFNIETLSEKKQQAAKSCKYKFINSVKCSIRIMRDEIEPTKEFIEAIENALNKQTDEEKLNAIEALWQEFGCFCKINSNSETYTEFDKTQFSSSLQGSSLSYKSEKDSSIFVNKSYNYYMVIGGDDSLRPDINDSRSQEKWFETLYNCDKWKPINYSEVIWIYDLLDDKLRTKLLKLFGQDVLLYDACEVVFNNTNMMKPKKIEIKKIPPDMANNQIYATVYKTNCIDENFSVHVVYHKLKIIAGLHFCQNKQNILTKPLEIHWSIITTEQEYKEMSWNKTGKRSIYKGQDWSSCAIEGDKQKLFFSLLSEDDCSPFFVNVNPMCPTLHLFNIESEKNIISKKLKFKKQDTENLEKKNHIAYLI